MRGSVWTVVMMKMMMMAMMGKGTRAVSDHATVNLRWARHAGRRGV